MYGAFLGGTLRGLAELRPNAAGRSSYYLGPEAEAAFAVERPFRATGSAPLCSSGSPRRPATVG